MGGRCRHVSDPSIVQMLIDRAAAGPMPYTDLIVDHRLASDYACEPSHAGLHRILLVNPEERASQPQDFFDAWLIRPLREKSLIDVLSGRMRGFRSRDVVIDPPPLAPRDEPDAASGLDVLLGEDDPVNAMLVKAILKKAGHRVRLVTDFPSLLEAATGGGPQPDLVICDMHMPGGTLVEFLKTLRAAAVSSRMPVMILTGEAGSELHRELVQLGADRVLQKPVDPDTLQKEVKQLVAGGTILVRAR